MEGTGKGSLLLWFLLNSAYFVLFSSHFLIEKIDIKYISCDVNDRDKKSHSSAVIAHPLIFTAIKLSSNEIVAAPSFSSSLWPTVIGICMNIDNSNLNFPLFKLFIPGYMLYLLE